MTGGLWMWFWRPMGEFLGTVAFFGALIGVCFIGICLWVGGAIALDWIKRTFRREQPPAASSGEVKK